MTTGLPKAAVVKHSRYILASSSSTIVMGCNPNDILYDTLPLYHTVGGMIALGGTMKHGITVVMKKKFSAKMFWTDCVKYQVTVAVYIGELCRYLLNTKEIPEEKQHNVRHSIYIRTVSS